MTSETFEPITFGTLNVRGLNARKKQCQLQRLLNSEKIDFLAVQETKLSTEEDVTRVLQPFLAAYEVCVAHSQGLSGGCFLFLKKSVPLTNLTATTDEQGRLAFCDFTLGRMEWRVVCLYAPNRGNERLAFFREVQRVLNCERALVVMGDFNCVTRERDRARSSTQCDHSARALLEMTEEFNLFDVGVLHSFSKQMKYTHFQGTSHARLDRVYVSSELLDGLTDYRVRPMYFSDHCLVTMNFGNKPRSTSKFDRKR